MRAPEEITTERLRLRPPTDADADAIRERYAGDPEVTRYVGWPTHDDPAITAGFLAFSRECWERDPAGPYLIESRDDGRLLGSTGLGFRDRETALTGYVLARDAWGRGIATESLRAMVALAAQLEVSRLLAHVHPEHLVSRRVLEKCGFAHETTQAGAIEFPNLDPPGVSDVCLYARRP